MSAQERADEIRSRFIQSQREERALLTNAISTTLANMHPDTFVQGAIWRTYVHAPVALSAPVFLAIWDAEKTNAPQAVQW